MSQALHGLINTAAGQDRQIAMLWQAIEKLSAASAGADCVPESAARDECFEAERLNQLVGK